MIDHIGRLGRGLIFTLDHPFMINPVDIPLHQHVIKDEDFKKGRFTTNYLDTKLPQFNVRNMDTVQAEENKKASIFSRFLY